MFFKQEFNSVISVAYHIPKSINPFRSLLC
nr:MAG TPA: hypothetical protein [Bacteriophage sp.]